MPLHPARSVSSPAPPTRREPDWPPGRAEAADAPVLCRHCGRTATNGIVCQGMCVADDGY